MPFMHGHFVLKYGWLDMAGMEARIKCHGSRTKMIYGRQF